MESFLFYFKASVIDEIFTGIQTPFQPPLAGVRFSRAERNVFHKKVVKEAERRIRPSDGEECVPSPAKGVCKSKNRDHFTG